MSSSLLQDRAFNPNARQVVERGVLDVACEFCGATPGNGCVTSQGVTREEPHQARLDRYAAAPWVEGDKRCACPPKLSGVGYHPRDVGFHLGASHGEDVWVSIERPILCLGPARSGKGVHIVIPMIIEAPGAVVNTSTRVDNYEATAFCRAARGDIYCFNLDDVGSRPHTVAWSPLEGCENARIANWRAITLVASSGLGGENQVWATAATAIVQAMLHAAALDPHMTIEDCYLWSRSPQNAETPLQILIAKSDADPTYKEQWQKTLEYLKSEDARMLANKWFGVENAFAGMAVYEVRKKLMHPTPYQARLLAELGEPVPEVFDTVKFLRSAGTVYMVARGANSTDQTSGTVGNYYSLFLDHVTDCARDLSQNSKSGRLDPPLALVLDELANIHPWRAAGRMMSAGSGEGIQTVAVFQSREQANMAYGKEMDDVMWDNSMNIMLGNSKSEEHLTNISSMIGRQQVTKKNTSHDKSVIFGVSTSHSVEEKAGIEPDELRRLPFGVAAVLEANSRLVIVDMPPYWRRAHADCVSRSQEWHHANPGKTLKSVVIPKASEP